MAFTTAPNITTANEDSVSAAGTGVPISTVRHDEARRDGARGLLGKHAAAVDAQSAGLPVGGFIAFGRRGTVRPAYSDL